MTKYKGFIGTYTKKSSKGVYEIELDTEKEALTVKGVAAEMQSPTYVNMDADQEYLYTVAPGGMASYKVGDSLSLLAHANEKDGSPCHVSVSPDGQYAASATYLDGTIALYNRDKETGKVTEQLSVVQHEGNGPNEERQDAAHAHYSGFSPDGKYIVAVDLGTDEIISYSYQSGELKHASTFNAEPGAGPRHLVFHPEKPLAYVMTELSNEVLVLAYDSENGSFRQLQAIPAIPGDFKENSQGSAIHITSDGKFVYAGNRGHNSIAVYAADENSGELTHIEYVETEGNWPRDFSLDPSETYVVAANQESDSLVLFKRDAESGRLTATGVKVEVPEPVCVKFISN
ncbi:lactonase family protein [Jeotgalibacillus salarius]|uniref:Lactonase family protein n=1 Tax=Jeotgalibacillus salarius TaxID=546023 RepID=A0A4Y8LIR7_9BACL|nr:lactonase family protein [Jeotgalibacillus salarius]TFE02085.1 lactonase family protein [Jeotgalibacillus salarius]